MEGGSREEWHTIVAALPCPRAPLPAPSSGPRVLVLQPPCSLMLARMSSSDHHAAKFLQPPRSRSLCPQPAATLQCRRPHSTTTTHPSFSGTGCRPLAPLPTFWINRWNSSFWIDTHFHYAGPKKRNGSHISLEIVLCSIYFFYLSPTS
jgi:hypothetical protein